MKCNLPIYRKFLFSSTLSEPGRRPSGFMEKPIDKGRSVPKYHGMASGFYT